MPKIILENPSAKEMREFLEKEPQTGIYLTGELVEKFLSMSDEEIEAALKGSKWQLFKRLDTEGIIPIQEYRKRYLSAIPENQVEIPPDNPCTQDTENSHHSHSEQGCASHSPE